jgi:hypothetical protein
MSSKNIEVVSGTMQLNDESFCANMFPRLIVCLVMSKANYKLLKKG